MLGESSHLQVPDALVLTSHPHSVDIAGVSVPKVQIALATVGWWRGDGISSGILGLGLPALTTAYTGTDRSRDGAANEVIYDPIVTSMTKNGIPPVFSLALSRNHSESYIAFGGVPPNVKTDSYASAPMRKLTNRLTGKSDYVYYLVVPEAVVFNSSTLSGKAAVLPNVVVDSGTTQILLSPRTLPLSFPQPLRSQERVCRGCGDAGPKAPSSRFARFERRK